MTFHRLAPTLALALLVGCESARDVAGPRAAPNRPTLATLIDQTNEQDVPWLYQGPNPCNGDYIVFNGTSHFIMHTGENLNGTTPGFHLDVKVISRGTGIGMPLALKMYDAKAEHTESVQVPDPTATWQIGDMLNVQGPTNADDFVMHNVFKLTYNANLVPTASFEKTMVHCKTNGNG